MVAPFQPDPEKVAAIRTALAATGAGIYLDTATAGPLATEGLVALREALAHEERMGRADERAREAFEERADETRAVLAALLGVAPDAVALTHGASAALAAAVWAPAWQHGGRIVTTDSEHPTLRAELAAARARFGLDVDEVAIGDLAATPDGEAALLARFAAAITRDTRLVVLSHVTWLTGALLPIVPVAELARRVGAWVAIDGAQAVGAIAVDAAAAGPDVYAFSGYKWLLGPHGVGAAYRSPRLLAEAAPAPASATLTTAVPPTLPRPSVVALGRTVGWLEMYVGVGWALARSRDLAAHAWQALAAVPGVRLLTPGPPAATIIAFRIAGWPVAAAQAALGRRVFAMTHAVEELDALRISVAWFNTADELDRFVGAVAELAAATPETLPERPRLVVLSGEGGPE